MTAQRDGHRWAAIVILSGCAVIALSWALEALR